MIDSIFSSSMNYSYCISKKFSTFNYSTPFTEFIYGKGRHTYIHAIINEVECACSWNVEYLPSENWEIFFWPNF